ncbi:hypothetical protein QI633_09630 [Nocardioides sp. QY071]|uniref:hypothetical protein n=1 Tax=Nocardioides sp. QY071 TaxID=3044187 RepID=UPI00249B2C05|nr:hypothetical protein [Nocardioides sp. QY071]WGY04013.1 hypothetical protein QI633_09630 [Nocardioides sp. QY071]
MTSEKSPTGITRAGLNFDSARDALGELHRKANEGWDLLREGRKRSEQAKQADASRRTSDATRAPALNDRKARGR